MLIVGGVAGVACCLFGAYVYNKKKERGDNEGGEQESRSLFKQQFKSERRALKNERKTFLVDYNEDDI